MQHAFFMEGNFVNFKTYFRDACHPGCQKFYSQNEAISEKFQVGFSKNFTAKIRGYLGKYEVNLTFHFG